MITLHQILKITKKINNIILSKTYIIPCSITHLRNLSPMAGGQKISMKNFLLVRYPPLIIGLELHGRNWKKIEEIIGSRTCSQIRSHAQKYFQKLNKPIDCSVSHEQLSHFSLKS